LVSQPASQPVSHLSRRQRCLELRDALCLLLRQTAVVFGTHQVQPGLAQLPLQLARIPLLVPNLRGHTTGTPH
jgi:hypothetical protein